MINRYNIKENFDSNFSLILVGSGDKFSDVGKMGNYSFTDDVFNCLLFFHESDKFMELINSFEFILIVDEKRYNMSERLSILYKVSEYSYNMFREKGHYDPISYNGYSNSIYTRSPFNDGIEVELTFKIEKQFDMSNIGNKEEDFYNRLTQIRRDLKLKELGL